MAAQYSKETFKFSKYELIDVSQQSVTVEFRLWLIQAGELSNIMCIAVLVHLSLGKFEFSTYQKYRIIN